MKLPRYPKYKDSGVEFIGEVPDHWKRLALKRLTRKIGSGITPRGGNQVYVSSGVLFLRSQNIYDEGLRLDDVVFISAEIDEDMAATRVLPGDILLNLTGASLGRSALVPDDFRGGNVNQHVCIIRLETPSPRKFISYAMKSAAVKTQIEAAQNGAAREGLNYQQVGGILLVLPPDELEASSITRFLDTELRRIDSLTEQQQRLIELLNEKRQAVISHAVTKGLSPGVPMKPSGTEWLGDVPAHWEICRIASVYQEINEAGSDHLPILTVSIHDGVSDRQLAEDELDRKVNRSEGGSKYKRVEPGDLVYNMMRAWQGGFGAVTVPGQISPAYVVARPKRQVSSRFIELLLRTPQAIEEVRCSSYGVADFRLRLYWEKFKDIRVAIPPVEEQTRILKHIETICKKIDNLINSSTVSIATLQERRSALISAAVTGKIDVRGFASTEAA